MGKWVYRKLGPTSVCEICVKCNRRKQASNGRGVYRPICYKCRKERDGDYSYRINKKEICERCGFKAEHQWQLDVHHLDANHANNKLDNLQTLCANCHRLITAKARENRAFTLWR